jgi:ATP-binding protein involved in chromosome partitioning
VQFLRLVKWGDESAPLDVLLIDLPPGTGDVTISLAQNAKIDGMLLVTTPQKAAVIDADKCAIAFGKLGIPLVGVVENMSYYDIETIGKKPVFGSGGGHELAEKYNVSVLGQLPLDPAIGLCADAGKNFIAEQGDSKAARVYREIAKTLVG